MEVRPNAVRLGIVVVLGVVFTLTLWLVAPGLFGLSEAPATTQVSATVTKGAGCGASDGEIVTFKQDGQEHRAKFDACGHRDGEPVSVSVPAGDLAPDLVVHAAEAATGENGFSRALAFLLFLASSLAGGAFIHLWLNVIPRRPAGARPAPRILPGIPSISSLFRRPGTPKRPDPVENPSLTGIPSLADLSLPDIAPVEPAAAAAAAASVVISPLADPSRTGMLPVSEASSTAIHPVSEATSKVAPVAEPSWTATGAADQHAPGAASHPGPRMAAGPVSDASRTAIHPVSDLSQTAITPVGNGGGVGIPPVSDASRTEIHPVARPVSELSSTEIHPVRPLRDE